MLKRQQVNQGARRPNRDHEVHVAIEPVGIGLGDSLGPYRVTGGAGSGVYLPILPGLL
jgi:hypothetical protein